MQSPTLVSGTGHDAPVPGRGRLQRPCVASARERRLPAGMPLALLASQSPIAWFTRVSQITRVVRVTQKG